jgi:hypothetical protein
MTLVITGQDVLDLLGVLAVYLCVALPAAHWLHARAR